MVNWGAQTGVSFIVLGHPRFKDVIGVFNRHIHVKTPRTYSRKVEATAESLLSKVSDIVSAVKSTVPSIVFTNDMWTILAQVVCFHIDLIGSHWCYLFYIFPPTFNCLFQDNYMSLTLSFIDLDWKLHRWCPFVKPFPSKLVFRS